MVLNFSCDFKVYHRCLVISESLSRYLFLFPYWLLLNRASTSTRLISDSTQLSTIPSTLLELNFCTQLGNFPKFRPKNSKLSVFPENRHTWYLDDADFYSNISFLNFQTLTYFWLNLCQTCQSCPFCLKIGTHGISRMLILIPTLVF